MDTNDAAADRAAASTAADPSASSTQPAPRVDVRAANAAWEALMTAHATLMARFAAEDMWGDVNMREYDVLYTLAKADAPLRLCEIQEGVLLSQPALSRMVDRLVGRGLLTRVSDAADRRAVRISLTEEGVRVQRTTGRAHAKSVARDLGRALTPDEMRTLEALSRTLVDSLTDNPTGSPISSPTGRAKTTPQRPDSEGDT